MKIGVFDSGLGGLTVLKEIIKAYPSLDTIFLADTLRIPYGLRPQEEVVAFSKEITDFLLDQGAEIIVIGCNTATAYALDALNETYPHVPIFGIIEPGAKLAAREGKNNIGVMATKATIESEVYDAALEKYLPGSHVVGSIATDLVPIVEAGLWEEENSIETLKNYLEPVKACDTIVLGCTHYPVLQEAAEALLPKTTFINPALGIVEEIKPFVRTGGSGSREYFVTGDVDSFVRQGSLILEEKIQSAKKKTW